MADRNVDDRQTGRQLADRNVDDIQAGRQVRGRNIVDRQTGRCRAIRLIGRRKINAQTSIS